LQVASQLVVPLIWFEVEEKAAEETITSTWLKNAGTPAMLMRFTLNLHLRASLPDNETSQAPFVPSSTAHHG